LNNNDHTENDLDDQASSECGSLLIVTKVVLSVEIDILVQLFCIRKLIVCHFIYIDVSILYSMVIWLTFTVYRHMRVIKYDTMWICAIIIYKYLYRIVLLQN